MLKRKKTKYKHAVVGGKKYYLYKICWIDPCGDSGHAEADEVKKLMPAKMITQGYIFAKDLCGHLQVMIQKQQFFPTEMYYQDV